MEKTFFILVKTNSPETELLEFEKAQGAYRMNVHAAPEKGKANREIIKFFKKKHKIDVEIISGFTSRKKLLKNKSR